MKKLFVTLLISSASFLFAQKQLLIIDREEHGVFSYDLNNIDVPPFLVSESNVLNPYDLIIDEETGQLWWSDGLSHQILKGDISQAGITIPIATDSMENGIAVDLEIDQFNKKIYWVDNTQRKIFRSNFDGTDREVIPVANIINPTSLAIFPSADLLFYADLDSNVIWSSTLSGENIQVIFKEDIEWPTRLAISPNEGKVYWTDDGLHTISRGNFDGTEQEIVYWGGSDEYPFGIVIDTAIGQIYWSDYGTQTIRRMNTDGTSQEIIIQNELITPVGLAFYNKLEGGLKLDRQPLEINESETQPGVSVFPNPASETVHFASLSINQPIQSLRIFDKYGRELMILTIGSPSASISISQLPEGYYQYAVNILDQTVFGRFAVAR